MQYLPWWIPVADFSTTAMANSWSMAAPWMILRLYMVGFLLSAMVCHPPSITLVKVFGLWFYTCQHSNTPLCIMKKVLNIFLCRVLDASAEKSVQLLEGKLLMIYVINFVKIVSICVKKLWLFIRWNGSQLLNRWSKRHLTALIRNIILFLFR